MSNIDLQIYDPTKVRGLFDELRGRLDETTAENRRLQRQLSELEFHIQDLQNRRRNIQAHVDELQKNVEMYYAQSRYLREALGKCVDTFSDFEKTLRLLNRPLLADACAVALQHTRSVLERQ